MILILDMSLAMTEKDLKPSRYLLSLRYAQEFIREFFEQNPISQIGILGMREGVAVRVSELSGNPADHIAALQALRTQEPKGNPSLQNALEMARASLFHTPTHGTREVVIIFGALLSSDPGDVHKTINTLVLDKIRVSVVGLAARMAVCSELCSKTHGVSVDSNPNIYGIALNEQHFRELFFYQITPPVMRSADVSSAPSLMVMGFPSRVEEDAPTLCACHGTPTRGGFLCSRCQAKVCSLPSQCPTCDLQLIQSTHLARSYRHLFRLSNWEEVSWRAARKKGSIQCFGCLLPFPAVPAEGEEGKGKRTQKGASESSRYRCTACGEHFCVDCDVYAHEMLNSCAGCLSRPQGQAVHTANGDDDSAVDGQTNGNGHVPVYGQDVAMAVG